MSRSDLKTVVSMRIALGLFLAGLLFLSYRVLHLFLAPVAWALILAYVTWPVYRRLRRLLGAYVNTSALLMTLLLAGAFALPLLWAIAMLQAEVPTVYVALIDILSQGKEADLFVPVYNEGIIPIGCQRTLQIHEQGIEGYN